MKRFLLRLFQIIKLLFMLQTAKFLLIAILTLLMNKGFFAQMINNQSGKAFTDEPYFDEYFVRANQIKEISGNYSRKKDGDIVRETSDYFRYRFDSLGHLISTYEIKTLGGKTDTLYNFYEYNEFGKLSLHRKSEAGGISAYRYKYDSVQRMIEMEHRRDLINKDGQVVQSTLINKETMRYVPFKNAYKKVIYNSYNLPYMEEYEEFNADGYLIREIKNMRMAESEYSKLYVYNEKGRLAKLKYFHNDEEQPYEEWQFRYDEFGNVIEKHIYKRGVFKNDIQIIYDMKTGLLGSTIQKEVGANFMMILRLNHYHFFDRN
jgi:YD repeat-containing protein